MANPIRRFFESLAYAGLKPSGGVSLEPKPPRRFGALRERIELFLNGGRPSDPLYLTNRTWKQKMRAPLLVGIPLLLMFGALSLIFTNVFAPKAPPPKQLTPAEMMASLLPDLEKKVNIKEYTDAEIVELRVVRDGAPRVVGTVRNKTDHVVSMDLDVEVADSKGSRVATVTERVDATRPNGDTHFEFAAGDPDATYALVRKIRPVR